MDNRITIQVKASPRASREKITLETDGVYKIYITAPPVDGKANEAIIKIIAKKTGIAQSYISIVRGESSRLKSVSITGISKHEIEKKLLS